MVEVRRKEHETVGALLRRFTRRVQQSGILIQFRKQRFHSSAPTRRQVRERAFRRLRVQGERRKLEKLGKLETRQTQ